MARRRRGYYLNRYVDSTGPLNLFVACVKDNTKGTVARLRAAGLSAVADLIEETAHKVAVTEVTRLTDDALKTARRHVPIDSKELQQKHIRAEIVEDASGFPEGVVYVDADNHYGSRRKSPEVASVLARFLDEQNFNRSRTNGPHRRNSSTSSWVEDAKQDFRLRKAAIIRREI